METLIGKVTHYFNRLEVAVLQLSGDLHVGDTVCFVGRITDFEQNVGSLEIQHQKISTAAAGQEVALKVYDKVRPGDLVYKIAQD
jgi:translation elongation factor EF-1alpha